MPCYCFWIDVELVVKIYKSKYNFKKTSVSMWHKTDALIKYCLVCMAFIPSATNNEAWYRVGDTNTIFVKFALDGYF